MTDRAAAAADDDEDDEEETFYDAGEEEGEGQESLYPGPSRALYSFDQEGTAEMALAEDQVVVGQGGGDQGLGRRLWLMSAGLREGRRRASGRLCRRAISRL